MSAPPNNSLRSRSSEELCAFLRKALHFIGQRTDELPAGSEIVDAVKKVRAVSRVLEERAIDLHTLLGELTQATGWDMELLLQECRNYPQTVPYVQDLDGNREKFRCRLCRGRERPEEDAHFLLCDQCLQWVAMAIHFERSVPGIFLFRSPNTEYHCEHGDGQKLRARLELPDGLRPESFCQECIAAEQRRRENGHQEAG